MPYSKQTFPYTGGARTFTIALAMGYIEEDDIRVYVVGELDGGGDQLYRTFTFDSEFVVNVTLAIDNPSSVVVERTVSPSVFDIDFTAGSDFTSANLMTAFKQNFMLMQEILDGRIDDVDVSAQATNAAASAAAAAASAAAAAASAATINGDDVILRDGSVDFTAVITGVAPTSDLHLATKKYVDDSVGGGGVMLLDGSQQMTGQMNLKAATAPVADDHASNKKYVDDSITTGATTPLALKAPLASPTLTGAPLSPTAAPGTDTTQIASTAFVAAAIIAAGSTAAWTLVETAYDFSIDGIVASVVTADFVDNFEYMIEIIDIGNNDGGNANFEIDVFGATSAAYLGPRQGNHNVNNSTELSGRVYFPDPRVSQTMHVMEGFMGLEALASNNFNDMSGAWFGTAEKITKVKLAWETSSIDQGVVKVYKRAV